MRNDEFNHVEIKNNYSGFEYGKIPGLETSPFKGNPSLNNGNSNANSTETINNVREKNALLGKSKTGSSNSSSEKTNTQKLKEVANVSSSMGTGAAVTGGALVAVTSIATIVGINVLGSTKAKFSYIEASEHVIEYGLSIESPTENLKYFVYLSGDNKTETNEVTFEEENFTWGAFENLKEDTEYTISVKTGDVVPVPVPISFYSSDEPIEEQTEEKTSSSEELVYEYKIRTLKEPEPEPEPAVLNSFIFDKSASFLTNTFEVSFTYFDPRDEMDNFVFTLTSPDGAMRDYPLQKTTEIQTLYGDSNENNVPSFDFTLGLEFDYQFKYDILDRTYLYEEGKVTFTDNTNSKQEFRGVTLDTDADFLQKCIYVTLNMDNELGHFSDFQFTLNSIVYGPIVFDLETTTRKQALYIRNGVQPANGSDIGDFTLEDNVFTYSLTYKNRGETVTVTSENEVTFTDISGAVQEFRNITIHSDANFLTKTIYVTLDMDNDYVHFSDFSLRLTSQGQPTLIFTLEAITTKQALNIDDAEIETVSGQTMDGFTLRKNFYYELSYKDRNETKTLSSQNAITFNDISGAKSEFRGIEIDSQADLLNSIIYVTIDMDNELNEYSSFFVILASNDFNSNIYIDLETTTERQSVDVKEALGNNYTSSFDLSDYVWRYSISYYFNKDYQYESNVGTVTFVDSANRKTEFNSITFKGYADYDERTFDVTLDFDDDYDYYSNFVLKLKLPFEFEDPETGEIQEATYVEVELAKTTEEQTVEFPEMMLEIEQSDEIEYTLLVNHAKKGVIQVANGATTFARSSMIWDYNLGFNAACYNENYYVFGRIDLEDRAGQYGDITLTIQDYTAGSTSYKARKEYVLNKNIHTFQYININDFLEAFKANGGTASDSQTIEGYPYEMGIKFTLKAMYKGSEETLWDSTDTLVLNPNNPYFYSANLATTVVDSSAPALEFQVFAKEINAYQAVRVVLEFGPNSVYTGMLQEPNLYVDFSTNNLIVPLDYFGDTSEILTLLENNDVTIKIVCTDYYGDSEYYVLESGRLTIN